MYFFDRPNRKARDGLTTSCLPALLLRISLQLTAPSYQGPGTVPVYPWVVGFSSLPAHSIIQTSQSHPPMRARAPHTVDFTKPASYTPMVHSAPVCNPCVALHGVPVLLPRAVSICMKCFLCNASSVGCYVFNYPQNSRVGLFPY
jgi:hypothetical protein